VNRIAGLQITQSTICYTFNGGSADKTAGAGSKYSRHGLTSEGVWSVGDEGAEGARESGKKFEVKLAVSKLLKTKPLAFSL